MRQVVIVTGVLGGGSALVFALAATVAAVFPTGTLVSNGWNGGRDVFVGGGVQAWPGNGPMVIDDVGTGTDIDVPPDVAPMPVVVSR